MSKGIYILHPSELVRKGLSAVLRNFFNVEITIIHSFDELKLFYSTPKLSLIFTNIYEKQHLDVVNECRQNSKLKVILLTETDSAFSELAKPDYCLSINTSSSEIQELVSGIFKQDVDTKETNDEDLTVREKDVLKLVALGFTNKEISEQLCISIHTVISHRKNITIKLGIKSISGLTVYAMMNQILDPKEIDPEKLI